MQQTNVQVVAETATRYVQVDNLFELRSECVDRSKAQILCDAGDDNPRYCRDALRIQIRATDSGIRRVVRIAIGGNVSTLLHPTGCAIKSCTRMTGPGRNQPETW